MAYSLLLAEERVKQHQITALHLICATAFMAFGGVIARFSMRGRIPGIILLLLGLGFALFTVTQSKKLLAGNTNKLFRIGELVIALLMIGFSVMVGWKIPIGIFGAIGVAVAYALYNESRAGAGTKISVQDDGLILPPGTKIKTLKWTDTDQVLLKFGVLTINTVDNTLLQWQVRSIDFDLDTFNRYCAQQIAINVPNRQKVDW